MTDFDVIVVGFGPTGKVLAHLLTEAGKSIAVVERWPSAYPLPRAVGFDHEIMRMFRKIGVFEGVSKISRPMHHYVWYNADWKVLVDIDQTMPSPSGDSMGYLFNQPELEEVLDAHLEGREGLTRFMSHEALDVQDAGDTAQVTIAPFDAASMTSDAAQAKTISAKYVVGCDGANSIVRQKIGSDMVDHGFDADWLVVDVIPNEENNIDAPDAAQWCNPDRPTTIVPSGVKNRRWEFMVKPGEDAQALASDESVWNLLSQWMTPEDGEIIRKATYNFRSLLAKGWRKGRLLIAGDAAHQMPPFMGQGMCSGLRDAWTLGWTLNAVLEGKAAENLLNSYEASRAPQVDQVIGISMQMGQVVCVPDPNAAAERDAAFFGGHVPPPPPFPGIVSGVLDLAPDGAPKGLAGQLMPHSEVTRDGVTSRLDDLKAGQAWMLLVNGLPHSSMTPAVGAAIEALGAVVVPFSDAAFKDETGRIDGLFEETGAKAILVRPDFYAYGAASSAEEAEALLSKAANTLAGVEKIEAA